MTFLYTNIGRGHPFYLDGIAAALLNTGRMNLLRRQTDVFEISRGVSLWGWKAVRSLYRLGASDSLIGKVYARIRRDGDYNRGGISQSLLGKTIREKYLNDPDVLVVAHPSLVAMLAGRDKLVYQHGELVVPKEAIVRGAAYVLVPTQAVADAFSAGGYESNRVIVTGLCIEPSLAGRAAETFEQRVLRINGQEPLTGAFFSSGAEPKAHVERLVHSAVSAIMAGGRAIVFAKAGGRLEQSAVKALQRRQVEFDLIDSGSALPADLQTALVVTFSSRREEDVFTGQFFPKFDYFVGPSHERTNWAVGLGLPMFVVGPAYGPFSPLNRALLLESGAAFPIDSVVDAESFGRQLRQWRQLGTLSEIAHSGWGRHPIGGFQIAANFLSTLCEAP